MKNLTRKIQTGLNIISYVVLLLNWVYVIKQFKHLPNIIPTHFDAYGTANGFGEKNTIWVLPIIATILTIMMSAVIKLPQKLQNRKAEQTVTPSNYFEKTAFTLSILKLNILLLFFYITYTSIREASQRTPSLGKYFIFVFLLAVLTPTFFLILQSFNLKKKTYPTT